MKIRLEHPSGGFTINEDGAAVYDEDCQFWGAAVERACERARSADRAPPSIVAVAGYVDGYVDGLRDYAAAKREQRTYVEFALRSIATGSIGESDATPPSQSPPAPQTPQSR